MKYILRSIKYFVYLAIMLAIFIAALLALGFIEGPIDNIFKNGADSIWQMALIVAASPQYIPCSATANAMSASGESQSRYGLKSWTL